MAKTRRSPGPESRAASTPPSDALILQSEADQLIAELRRIKAEDGDLFTLLLNGTYRLARPCAVCGRALTKHQSRAAGIGPTCSARGGHR
jgi:hypothetical protein